MKVNLITACGKNGEIGLNNKLLWHIPEDFKKFKELTSHSIIIMGRNTFESLPGILPNRFHIVVTSKDLEENENVIKCESIEKAIEIAKNLSRNIWIIGGAQIYNYCLENDLIDNVYLSEVDYEGPADTYINKDLINKKFKSIFKENYNKINKTLAWSFNIYERIR